MPYPKRNSQLKLILILSFSWMILATSSFSQPSPFTIQELHQQKRIAELKNDTLALAWTYHRIAKIKMPEEIEQDSIYFYLINAKLLADGKDDSLSFEINDNLIYWTTHHDQNKETKHLIDENIAYARQVEDDFLLMRSYFSHSEFYAPARLNQVDSSLFYSTKGLKIAQDRKDTVHIAIAKYQLASFYLKIDSLQEEAFQNAQDLLLLSEYQDWMEYLKAPANIYMGDYYLNKSQYPKAIAAYKAGIEVGEKTNSIGYLQMGYRGLSRVLEKTGQYQLALEAYKKQEAFQDTVFNQKNRDQIAQLEIQFETEKNELALQNLEKEKQFQKKQIVRQGRLIALISFLSILFLLLLGSAIINYRKRLESNKTLLAAQQELDNARSRFFTNISHEFRTPLTVISGMANRIKNPDQRKIIQRNSESLLGLVNQVLDLSKLESGNLTLQLHRANIVPYLEYLTESFHSLSLNKNIKINFYYEEREVVMDYDAEKIKLIFVNLLSNALKFTEPFGKIYIAAKVDGQQFQLEVKDTGIGISTEDLPHIFDRFYQEKNSSYIGGTGVGLALVKELSELMGGSIKVESTKGQGACFTLCLPITQNAKLAKDFEFNTAPVESTKNEKGLETVLFSDQHSILVIEDNPDVIQYIASCLSPQHHVIKAFDGVNGLAKAEETIPDIILTDVMMPKKNGYEVCESLKANSLTSHIPIIMLTAKATDEEKLKGLKYGADAYLIKPFNESELQVRVNNLLENQKRWQEKFQQEGFPNNGKTLSPEEKFLFQAKDTFLLHLDQSDYTVDFYCRDLGISRTQLHRKLKALTGLSTSQFMNSIRLAKAKELLQESEMNVSEVAYAVGFQHPNYFSKLYIKQFGLSPNETRK